MHAEKLQAMRVKGKRVWDGEIESKHEARAPLQVTSASCPPHVLVALRDAYGKPTHEIGYETDGALGLRASVAPGAERGSLVQISAPLTPALVLDRVVSGSHVLVYCKRACVVITHSSGSFADVAWAHSSGSFADVAWAFRSSLP